MADEATKPAWYVRLWTNIKLWCWKFCGALFFEEKKDGHQALSLGRVGFLFTVGWMAYFWGSWDVVASLSSTDIATMIIAQLPEGHQVTGVDVIAASDKVLLSLPRATEPPLLKVAFLTMAAYVLGSKGMGVIHQRLNGRNE